MVNILLILLRLMIVQGVRDVFETFHFLMSVAEAVSKGIATLDRLLAISYSLHQDYK